jgi:membrane protein involved in colicin uptake
MGEGEKGRLDDLETERLREEEMQRQRDEELERRRNKKPQNGEIFVAKRILKE